MGEVLELHAEESRVCLYFQQKMIASHARKFFAGMTTEPGHMPERHQKHHSWSPGRLKNWAKDIDPDVLIWVDRRLSRREYPEQSYRVWVIKSVSNLSCCPIECSLHAYRHKICLSPSSKAFKSLSERLPATFFNRLLSTVLI